MDTNRTWTGLAALGLALALAAGGSWTQGCITDVLSSYVDKQDTVEPEIWLDATEIHEGEALLVHGCVEHFVDGAYSDWELELLEEVDGSHVEISGILSWRFDEEYVDDDGTDYKAATVQVSGLTAGTYVVSSGSSDGGGCAEDYGGGPAQSSYTVTVLP